VRSAFLLAFLVALLVAPAALAGETRVYRYVLPSMFDECADVGDRGAEAHVGGVCDIKIVPGDVITVDVVDARLGSDVNFMVALCTWDSCQPEGTATGTATLLVPDGDHTLEVFVTAADATTGTVTVSFA
jgi:hypothetical protein